MPSTPAAPDHTETAPRNGSAEATEQSAPDSFASGPKDEWDREMKENYEAGGELKMQAEKALEDYRTGNTSRLP